VIGAPDERWGETPAAIAVLQPDGEARQRSAGRDLPAVAQAFEPVKAASHEADEASRLSAPIIVDRHRLQKMVAIHNDAFSAVAVRIDGFGEGRDGHRASKTPLSGGW
jgi:acyl-CoA synthetase (AMP-forming)/AMP-acid ligase II